MAPRRVRRSGSRLLAVLVAVVAALALIGACGGTDGTSSPAPASDEHNDADVRFAQEMIPHHLQALMMSRLAESNDAGPEVRDFADRIEQAQRPEIEQMDGWLEEWDEDSRHGGMGTDPGDLEGTGDLPGMMSPGDMRSLARARGAAFDELFLTQMIEHHEVAVEMARRVQDEGRHEGSIALAESIEESQTAEIAEMQEMLAS